MLSGARRYIAMLHVATAILLNRDHEAGDE
jgi:hypothetical protein